MNRHPSEKFTLSRAAAWSGGREHISASPANAASWTGGLTADPVSHHHKAEYCSILDNSQPRIDSAAGLCHDFCSVLTMSRATITVLFAALVSLAAQRPGLAARVHPSLLTTPAGIELAKKRIAQEPWAKEVLQRLTQSASALEKEPLPVFETEWWKEASKKRWQDIYPEINLHTSSAVSGPMQRTSSVAIAYALTGDRKYAEIVRKVLLHYANYQFFAKHPDVGMNWSIWCMPALQSYDFVYSALSEADHRIMDGFFQRALTAILDNDKDWLREGWGGRFNNHYSYHKLFIGTYGLFYGKQEYVDYAIESEEGFRDLIENATRDDGLWLRIQPQLSLHGGRPDRAVRRRAGQRRPLSGSLEPPVRQWKAAAGLLHRPDPDVVPGRHDSDDRRYLRPPRLAQGNRGYFEAFNAFPDPLMGWVLRDAEMPPQSLFLERLPQGPYASPQMKTRLWPEHGYVALRTQEGVDYWKGDGYSVFLSFDLDGIHSHSDKFDLMVFARGAHIAVDPEAVASARHAFSAQIQNELNRHTVCHNTVMVDGQNHRRIDHRLTLADFIDGDGVKLATIEAAQGVVSPGVKMTRTVAATPDYVLDIFQVASKQQHTYDYLFHSLDDQGAFRTQGSFSPIDLGAGAPWSWLKNARQTTVDGEWNVTASQKELKSRLLMLGQAGTRLITCDFPKNDRFEAPAVPMLMARRTAASTVFVSLLQAERGDIPEVKIASREDRNGLLRITVNCRGAVREFTARRISPD